MNLRLSIKNGDAEHPDQTLEIPVNGIVTVGSEPSATIHLTGSEVAPEQFVIVGEDPHLTLLCRVDGTVINGEALPQGALHNLQPGDLITVGDYTLKAETDEPAAAATARNGRAPTGELPKSALPDSPAAIHTTNPGERLERSLSDVLEGLRAEEKFYFQVERAAGASRRIYVESEEMWLGWSEAGDCLLTIATDEIVAPRAQVRKDWSGVLLYPLQPGHVWLNERPLTEPHRLKNDDRIALLARESNKVCQETLIRFHEPTALLVLDSILPKELPPPISLDEQEKASAHGPPPAPTPAAGAASSTGAPRTTGGRLFFGYFSLAEIIIMAVGTLITAAVIFLILELY